MCEVFRSHLDILSFLHLLTFQTIDPLRSMAMGAPLEDAACSGGRIVSWIIYCWLVWCERKILFSAGNLRSFTSKRTCWWPLRLTSSIASLWCLKKLQERTDRLTVQLMNHRGRQRATRCSSYLLSDKHHRPRIHSPKPSVDGLRSWLPVMF